MKLAIVSDTHFGYAWESERQDDSFENAHEAFQRTTDADLVILPGDIYDHKVPKQEVLGRSIDCFNIYRDGACRLRITDKSDVDYDFQGTPLVAIHGTHERRAQGFVNPIELLDKMGYLLHLHNEKVVFEHEETGETVAVHGMSGVPERYAPGVLEKFAPEPVDGAYNVFVFHQSVKNFVYTSSDHPALTLEDLPEGFDLLVDGHIHWYDLSNKDSDKPLILPGSTISTQMRQIEAEKPKGFVTVDTETDTIEFHELETPRAQYYEELAVDDMTGTEIMNAVEKRMQDVLSAGHEKPPLVRLILKGKTDADVKLSEIRKTYSEDAVLSLSKNVQSGSSGITPGSFKEETKSIAELGTELLREHIGDAPFQIDSLFELLAEEQLDAALDFVEELELPDENEAQSTPPDDDGNPGEPAAPEASERASAETAEGETLSVTQEPDEGRDEPDSGPKTLADFS